MYYFIVNPASKTGVGAKYWNRVEKVLKEKLRKNNYLKRKK